MNSFSASEQTSWDDRRLAHRLTVSSFAFCLYACASTAVSWTQKLLLQRLSCAMFGVVVHEQHELGASSISLPVFYCGIKILIAGHGVGLSFNPKFLGYFFLTVQSLWCYGNTSNITHKLFRKRNFQMSCSSCARCGSPKWALMFFADFWQLPIFRFTQ